MLILCLLREMENKYSHLISKQNLAHFNNFATIIFFLLKHIIQFASANIHEASIHGVSYQVQTRITQIYLNLDDQSMCFNYLPLLLIFKNSKVGSTLKVYSVGQKILLHESQLLLVFVTLVEPAGVSVMTSSSSHAKKSHVA